MFKLHFQIHCHLYVPLAISYSPPLISFFSSLSLSVFFVLRLSKSAEMMARNAMDRRWFDWCCLFHILLQTHNQPFLLCQWKLKKLKCKITVIPSGIKLVCLVLCFFFVVCLLFPPPFPFYIYILNNKTQIFFDSPLVGGMHAPRNCVCFVNRQLDVCCTRSGPHRFRQILESVAFGWIYKIPRKFPVNKKIFRTKTKFFSCFSFWMSTDCWKLSDRSDNSMAGLIKYLTDFSLLLLNQQK